VPVPLPRLAFVAVAITLVGLLSPWSLLTTALVANAVVVALFVVDVVLAPAPGSVVVTRVAPSVLTVGQRGRLDWIVHHPHPRRLTVWVADELAPSLGADHRRFRVDVPAGARAEVTTELQPSRRGAFGIGEVVVRVAGPLRLGARQGSRRDEALLRVNPPFRSREEAELRISKSRILDVGLRSTRGRGGGTDFDQLRDYQPDDEFRRIDWAATARAGRLSGPARLRRARAGSCCGGAVFLLRLVSSVGGRLTVGPGRTSPAGVGVLRSSGVSPRRPRGCPSDPPGCVGRLGCGAERRRLPPGEEAVGQDEAPELRGLADAVEQPAGEADVHAVEDQHRRRADAGEDPGCERDERHLDVVDQHLRRELRRRCRRVVVLELLGDVCLACGLVADGLDRLIRHSQPGSHHQSRDEQQRSRGRNEPARRPHRHRERDGEERAQALRRVAAPSVQRAVGLGDETREARGEHRIPDLGAGVSQMCAGLLVQPNELVEFFGGEVGAATAGPPAQPLEAAPVAFVASDEVVDHRGRQSGGGAHRARKRGDTRDARQRPNAAISCAGSLRPRTARAADGPTATVSPMPTAMARRPAGIITPEAVVLEFETAGVGSRMLARLIDGAVLWVGILVMTLGVLPVLSVSVELGIVVSIILVFVMIFFMLFGYWMLTETLMRGRTPGKAAMGLRVVTVEGAPVRFRHAAIRAMVGFVDFLTPPLGPVAVLSVLASPRDQRLGDMAAGTIVVRERSASAPAAVAVMVEPPGRPHLLAALSLSPLSDGQYRVLRGFLQRAPSLSPEARAQIGWRLSQAVSDTTGVERPADLHPEWFLHAAGLAHQRRYLAWTPGSQPPPPTGAAVIALAPPPTAVVASSHPMPPPATAPVAPPPPPPPPPASGFRGGR
jgi:uncharacterized RDD family membrane protein YckC